MKSSAILSLVLALSVWGCGGTSPEAVMDDQASVMNDLATVLEGIGNAEDLEAAKPKMRELGEQMKGLKERWEKMAAEGVSEADIEQISKEHAGLAKASERFATAMTKLFMNPKMQTHMTELMQEFGDVFDPK